MKQRLILRASSEGKAWSESDFMLGFKRLDGGEYMRAPPPPPPLSFSTPN